MRLAGLIFFICIVLTGCQKPDPPKPLSQTKETPLTSQARQFTPTELKIRHAPDFLHLLSQAIENSPGRGLSLVSAIEIQKVRLGHLENSPTFNSTEWRQYLDDLNGDGWNLKQIQFNLSSRPDENPTRGAAKLLVVSPEGQKQTRHQTFAIKWDARGIKRLDVVFQK